MLIPPSFPPPIQAPEFGFLVSPPANPFPARSVHDDVQAASIQRPVFRPFLVIVPPNAGETWTSQADKFFKAAETAHDLDVRTLGTLGAATSVASVVQRSIGTSAAKLSTWITEMHERRYDPATGRIGLIATLQGWQRAALSKNAKFRLKLDPGELARRRQQAAQARRRCGEDLEGDVDVDEDNADLGDDIYTDEEFEKIKEGLMLRIPMDAFDLCIIDEAHRVGNVGRLQAEAAYLLDAKFLLLTATPMKTNAKDFKGLLRFMFKGSAEQVRKSSFKPAPASYRKYAHILETQREGRLDRIRPNELIDYLAHLNPDSYASCLADASGKDALGGADLIPLIFMLCVLKRVKGSPVDLGKPPPAADDDATMSDGTPPDASNDTGGTIYRLGEEIPRCETVTVELAQLPLEKMFHRGVLDALANKEANPGPGKSDGAGTAGKKSSAAQFTRRTALALSAYNPRLFQFTQRYTHNRAGSVNKL